MKHSLTSRSIVRSSALAACVLALAACGDKTEAPGASGQWVAKVNEREITVHQVNAELAGAGAAGALPAATAQRRTVEGLVDRRLLVDAAVKNGKDRAPDVVLAIEKAKEQIIAQAYLRQLIGTPAKPTAAEIADFYGKNPALFASRKQYDMRQLVLATSAFSDDIKSAVDGAAGIDEVEAALASKNVKFDKARTLRTSAELPPAILGKVGILASGKPFVVRTPDNVVVATLSFVKDLPVSQQEAAPQIEQHLSKIGAQKAATAEIARLRSAAKVEYKSGFGPELAATTASAAPTAAAIDRAAAGLR